MEKNIYKIELDGDWKLEDLYDFPRTYLQVYNFLHSVQDSVETKDICDEHSRLKITYSAHPWRGGYSTINFYSHLKYLVPQVDRPKIKSIQYSSPGWIELALVVGIATNIRKIVTDFVYAGRELNTLYNDIYKGLQDRKLLRIKVEREEIKLQEEHLRFIEHSKASLSKMIGFNEIQNIDKLTNKPLITLKILLSFYRRIKILAKYSKSGKTKY